MIDPILAANIVQVIATAIGFYASFRIGKIVGYAAGMWGPDATKRLTAAREDAYANGLRHGRGHPDAHRGHIPDLLDRFPEAEKV